MDQLNRGGSHSLWLQIEGRFRQGASGRDRGLSATWLAARVAGCDEIHESVWAQLQCEPPAANDQYGARWHINTETISSLRRNWHAHKAWQEYVALAEIGASALGKGGAATCWAWLDDLRTRSPHLLHPFDLTGYKDSGLVTTRCYQIDDLWDASAQHSFKLATLALPVKDVMRTEEGESPRNIVERARALKRIPSFEKFAATAGISKDTLYAIMSGKRWVKPASYRSVAVVCGCAPEALHPRNSANPGHEEGRASADETQDNAVKS